MTNSAISLTDRLQGCLTGLLIGDVMGAPFRHMKDGYIRQVVGTLQDMPDPDVIHASKPGKWLPGGMHTAPSQLAFLLCNGLFVSGEINEVFLSMIQRALTEIPERTGLLREVSPELRRSLLGIEPEKGDPKPGEATAAIALVPMAMMEVASPSLLTMDDKKDCAKLLTPDKVANASALLFVETVKYALTGELDEPAILEKGLAKLHQFSLHVEGALEETNRVTSDLIQIIPGLLKEGNDAIARQSIVSEVGRHFPEHPITDPQIACAPANIAWAIYLSLKQRRFDQPVLDAVQGGRETSEMAALCGALSGARLGTQAIPAEWRKKCLASDLAATYATAIEHNDPSLIYEFDLFGLEAEWARQLVDGRAQRFKRIEDIEKKRTEKQDKKKPKMAPNSLPPTTYARRAQPPLPDTEVYVDPEEEKRMKLLRSKKRIQWKDERRKDRRKE